MVFGGITLIIKHLAKNRKHSFWKQSELLNMYNPSNCWEALAFFSSNFEVKSVSAVLVRLRVSYIKESSHIDFDGTTNADWSASQQSIKQLGKMKLQNSEITKWEKHKA